MDNVRLIGDKCGGFLESDVSEGEFGIPRVRIIATDLWTVLRVLLVRLTRVVCLVIIEVVFNKVVEGGKSVVEREVDDNVHFVDNALGNLEGSLPRRIGHSKLNLEALL